MNAILLAEKHRFKRVVAFSPSGWAWKWQMRKTYEETKCLICRSVDRERRIDETVPRSVQRTLELRRALRFRREDKAEENNADSERRNRKGPRQVTQTVRTVGGFIRE